MRLRDPQITVHQGDILSYPCDAILLKYAQAWHGADLEVSKILGLERRTNSDHGSYIAPGSYKFLSGEGKLAADSVLLEGTQELGQLSYAKIREFSRSSLLHLQESLPEASQIAMTVHGVNIGMDERECFLSQIAGALDALGKKGVLEHLQRITFVEKSRQRAERLRLLLQADYKPAERPKSPQPPPITGTVANAGLESAEKPHIFVAMPFSDEMEDVFIFGVQGPVQEAGFLCERIDMAIFSGDIVERIKTRIETAKLVIADLSGANANVYLEVGYAWGRKVTTLLVCRNVDDLKFDVKGQRCIIYSSINDLRKKLSEELKVAAK